MKDLYRDYVSAGFGSALGSGTSHAVVAVDLVRAYTDDSSSLRAPVDEAVAAACRVVEAARAAGRPVVLTRVEFAPGGIDGGIFYRKVPALKAFDRGSPFGAFVPGLTLAPTDITVTKQYASAFFGTSLASTLGAARVDAVIIVGLTTSGCVRATAVDAMQHGFIPLVVSDAVGDRDARVQDANLFDLGQKYAELIDEAQAVRILSQEAPPC